MANVTLSAETFRDIPHCVARALQEDIGSGDITAQLIPAEKTARAVVITREEAIVCGRPWVDEVFRQLDNTTTLEWHVAEGDKVNANQTLITLSGNARTLLTGERVALNFLQTLSATATAAHHYASVVPDSSIKILDTRKTIPGLRLAQKYAVTVGGCHNHRIGLYDAFLIKENHIAEEAANHFLKSLDPNIQKTVMGPAQPIINRIRNKYIWELCVKITKQPKQLTIAKKQLLHFIQLISVHPRYKSVQIIIDIDPN